MIDYNRAVKTYDNTRGHSDRLIDCFAKWANLSANSKVLDFGCGTGNYLLKLRERWECQCCGVEPSEGMRAAALQKCGKLDVREGDHKHVPFPDHTFNFIFMTDVVHHVPDLSLMFAELKRVVKEDGIVCVVTESQAQIQGRFYNGYFPSLAGNETRRYPGIDKIIHAATNAGFRLEATEALPAILTVILADGFLRNVEEKNYSMFRMLSEEEFAEGLGRLKSDIGKSMNQSSAGETLIWLRDGDNILNL